MRLKSFFAHDVQSALAMARRELGPDAMLVESKKAPPEAQHLGASEVVVALAPPPESRPAVAASEREPAAAPSGKVSLEMAGIRRQLERMAQMMARSTLIASARWLPSAELAEVFAALVESEVEPELAHDVLNCVRAAGVPSEPGPIRRALASELAARFSVEPEPGCGGARPAVAAFVGPCGSGKTTTLVKLAVLYGLTARRPTQIISMDTYRVAAAEQLRSYAAILGLGFQMVETAGALSQALEEHRHKDLILIDTPGYSLRCLEDAQELAGCLSGRPEVCTHLVLTASMKSADLSRVVDRFEVFRPRRLLFTKLDETETFGPLLNQAARTRKPISYLASGQQIPEDLEPATTERVVDLVLRAEAARAAAAAAA